MGEHTQVPSPATPQLTRELTPRRSAREWLEAEVAAASPATSTATPPHASSTYSTRAPVEEGQPSPDAGAAIGVSPGARGPRPSTPPPLDTPVPAARRRGLLARLFLPPAAATSREVRALLGRRRSSRRSAASTSAPLDEFEPADEPEPAAGPAAEHPATEPVVATEPTVATKPATEQQPTAEPTSKPELDSECATSPFALTFTSPVSEHRAEPHPPEEHSSLMSAVRAAIRYTLMPSHSPRIPPHTLGVFLS
jgi:hypothetical protein